MEFSYLIGASIVLQLIALKINRFIGALLGGVFTTIVLFYGMYLYSSSDTISLLGKYELSMYNFFFFIFVWYTLDVLKAGWEVSKRYSTKEAPEVPSKKQSSPKTHD